MNLTQIQKASSDLVAALWDKKYLPNDHPLVYPYIESQDVRNSVRIMCESFGQRVARMEKHTHLLVQPRDSILTNPVNEMKKTVKSWENKVDLYLIGVVWMVLFAEADNVMDTSKIKWENDGISYGEIEELVTKNLENWFAKDQESEGQFSRDWSLAVKAMHEKWKLLRYHKVENGRISYIKDSRFGVIDSAVRELAKDRMVFLEKMAQTARVTPTPVFFERLKARFGNLDQFQERYELLQILFQDTKNSDEVGA
jgi:hypothetical protein